MENSGSAAKDGKKPRNTAGLRKGGGRPKGAPNKMNGQLKEMILEALGEAGGIDYLVSRAHDQKTAAAFLGLVGKVLPMTVQGPNPDGSHTFTVNAPWLKQAIQQRNSA